MVSEMTFNEKIESELDNLYLRRERTPMSPTAHNLKEIADSLNMIATALGYIIQTNLSVEVHGSIESLHGDY